MGKEDTEAVGKPEDLQFDHANFNEAEKNERNETSCETCRKTIEDVYFEENGQVICGTCKTELEKSLAKGGGAGRVFRAVLFGIPAAALGSGIYYGISALTGYEIGLVALVIGLLVGGAVRIGSKGRGGWVYQGLAMILTYLAIVTTYIPYIMEGFAQLDNDVKATEQSIDQNNSSSASSSEETNSVSENVPPEIPSVLLWIIGSAFMILIACAAPFLAGLDNIIGLVIIGIGLYEAWKLNKRRVIRITGPFEIAAVGAEGVTADE